MYQREGICKPYSGAMFGCPVNCFIWWAKQDKIPSAVALSSKGVVVNSLCCSVCINGEENANHILVLCSFAQAIRKKVFQCDEEPVEGEGENARVELDDEENTDKSSDEDEIIYSIHNPKVKWNVMKLVIGERYESRHELKLCLTNYSIYKGYKIRLKKCDSVRLVAVCASDPEKCPFMVRASWMSTEKSFQEKKMNDRHTCVRNFSSSRLMNPTWLAKQFVKELVRKPKLKYKEMQTISQRLGMQCQVVLIHMKLGMAFKVMELIWNTITVAADCGI
ncbi:unnamed protein product [Lactuca virosa]|uniref:Transposase MuDR plant domain-containing protein n=1 Tax=Lactuca virosa TaxID=75947 RepID=A0AAU9P3M2_9ASTR|nr:unnamed protein product [Lactuca virosa]